MKFYKVRSVKDGESSTCRLFHSIVKIKRQILKDPQFRTFRCINPKLKKKKKHEQSNMTYRLVKWVISFVLFIMHFLKTQSAYNLI